VYYTDLPAIVQALAKSALTNRRIRKCNHCSTWTYGSKRSRISGPDEAVVKRVVSGWEYTNFFLDPLSGYPANLPGNAIMLKDPRTPGGGFSGTGQRFDAEHSAATDPGPAEVLLVGTSGNIA
jgi:hypothetical protein